VYNSDIRRNQHIQSWWKDNWNCS